MYMKNVEIYKDTDSSNNARLIAGEVRNHAMLTLTDRHVIHNLFSENKVTIDDEINTVKFTYTDEDGVEQTSTLKYICSVFSSNNIENNIYYNLIDKCMVNIPMVNELDADNLKDLTVDVDYLIYDNYRYDKPFFRNTMVSSKSSKNTLSEPNTLAGKEVSIVRISAFGLDVKSNVRYFKGGLVDGSTPKNVVAIELLAIKNVDLGLDALTSLHTIITPNTYTRHIIPVPNNNPEIIYIPLM